MGLVSLIFGKSHTTAFPHTEAIYNQVRKLYQSANHLYHLGRTLDRLRAEMESEDKAHREHAREKHGEAVRQFHKFKRSYLDSLASIRAHLEKINKLVRH